MMNIKINNEAILEITRKQLVRAYLSECKERDIWVSPDDEKALESYPTIEDGFFSIEEGRVVFHCLTYADPEFSEEPDFWSSSTYMKAGDLEEKFVNASRFALSYTVKKHLNQLGGVFSSN